MILPRFTYGNLVTTSPSSKAIDSFAFEKSAGEPISKQTPTNSPKTSIGRSDGQCVQNTGSYSMHADDVRLQGNPR